MTQTDIGWYRRNLRSFRALTEPVLDQVCEWLHQRYGTTGEQDFDGWSPGWRYFKERAPGWRPVRNAEPGECTALF